MQDLLEFFLVSTALRFYRTEKDWWWHDNTSEDDFIWIILVQERIARTNIFTSDYCSDITDADFAQKLGFVGLDS